LTVSRIEQAIGGDVYLENIGGVMIDQILANAGNVTIVATGLIESGGAGANIVAAGIDLSAGSNIGRAEQALRIDSAVGALGTVRAIANDNINLNEINGDLGLDLIASGGDVE